MLKDTPDSIPLYWPNDTGSGKQCTTKSHWREKSPFNNNSRRIVTTVKITTRRRQRPSYQRYLDYCRRKRWSWIERVWIRRSFRGSITAKRRQPRSNKPTSGSNHHQTVDTKRVESFAEAYLAEATAPGTTTAVEALLRLTAGSYYSAAVKNSQFVRPDSPNPAQYSTEQRQP